MYTYIHYEKKHSFSENIPISKIKFGWAICNEKNHTITEISPLFFCRDLHLQLLYRKMIGGAWELGSYYLPEDFIQSIDLSNLCLVVGKEPELPIDTTMAYVYDFRSRLANHFPSLGTKAIFYNGQKSALQFDNTNIYKFPLVLSYITLLMRASAFTSYDLTPKQFHELSNYFNIKDFQLLSKIPYNTMHKIITNINTYDSDKYARIIQDLTRSYGLYWASSGGVNFTLDKMWSYFKQIFE